MVFEGLSSVVVFCVGPLVFELSWLCCSLLSCQQLWCSKIALLWRIADQLLELVVVKRCRTVLLLGGKNLFPVLLEMCNVGVPVPRGLVEVVGL